MVKIHYLSINDKCRALFRRKRKKVFLSASQSGKDIVFEVRDEGVGIPEEDIRRVFEPFYTGKNGRIFGESTGMGLYIVSKICSYLGHSIKLESEVGKGTSIKIIFP